MMQKKAGAKETWAADISHAAFAASYLSGVWMNCAVSSFDELYEWITSDYEEEPLLYDVGNGDYSEGKKRHVEYGSQPSVTEVRTYLNGLKRTSCLRYDGLSAPLLGAVNPLPSAVIRGDNMPPPPQSRMTTKLERCKSVSFIFGTIFV
jgi:hypothetical protein